MNWDPEAFAEMVVGTIKKALLGPLVAGRIDALEQQLAELKARPALSFAGTYADTKQYAPGDCTTRQGSLWACTAATSGPFDHSCWQLAVKRGDAR